MNKMVCKAWLLLSAIFVVSEVSVTLAAEAPSAGDGQSLSEKATDPTAPLMAFYMADWFTPSFHHGNSDDRLNILMVRPVIPIPKTSIIPFAQIARLTLPYVTESPSKSGLADVLLFDLAIIDVPVIKGRIGVGPVVSFPTADPDILGSGQYSAGPAVGAVSQLGKLQLGALVQNLFSFAGEGSRAGVAQTLLQPIVNYSLPDAWHVGSGNMVFNMDWNEGKFTSIPLVASIGRVVKLGSIPANIALEPEYNLYHDGLSAEWTVRFSVTLLFPE